jgi:hypothetical protein
MMIMMTMMIIRYFSYYNDLCLGHLNVQALVTLPIERELRMDTEEKMSTDD